ncbi:hypothetical protein MMC22_009867 [Lobaria immixta]|nr:hypothetical protein [Lobaria immixta]
MEQLEKAKPSELPPGSQNFTKNQMFFISYANWFCSKDREAAAIENLYVDEHPTMWARVLGTVANSREFKQSFTIRSRSPGVGAAGPLNRAEL